MRTNTKRDQSGESLGIHCVNICPEMYFQSISAVYVKVCALKRDSALISLMFR